MALTKVIGSGIGTVTDNVVITSDDPTITMTDSSGTNDIGTIQSTSGALILTARDGSSDGEIIFKKTDGSATDETLRIKNSGNIGIGTNDPATQLHIENSSGNGSLQITSSTSGTSFINMGDTGDPDDGQISYLNSDLSMRFTTNAAEQVRIHSNGVLSASDGIALGVGTANTASNVLDDYEEGTFTATLTGASSAPNSAVTVTSHYTKVGNICNIAIAFSNVNTTGASGGLQVSGLPFASYKSSFGSYLSYNVANHGSSSPVNAVAWLQGSLSYIVFYDNPDSGVWNTTNIIAGTTKYLYLSLTYQTT